MIATRDLLSLWPQEHVSGDCLATLGMDVTAPFLSDMALPLESVEDLRAAFRQGIDGAPWVLSAAAADPLDRFTAIRFVRPDPRKRMMPTE
jgi:hypothetical protein